MVKMMLYAVLATVALTMAAPQMGRALRMEQSESALVSQITQDTTPTALQTPGADGRLTELVRRLLALVDRGSTTTLQAAAQTPRWVPVDGYILAHATPAQQVAP